MSGHSRRELAPRLGERGLSATAASNANYAPSNGCTARAACTELVRWSKKNENHLALLQLASGLIAFKKAHLAELAATQAG
jgi:hypothetical protein